MIINGVDYKDVPIPKHWKISERHVKDVRDLIFGETSAFQKFYKDKTLFPILEFIQKNSKDLIQLIDATNLFADIILNDNSVESTIINGNIISKLVKFYLLCSFYIYILRRVVDIDENDVPVFIRRLVEQRKDVSLANTEARLCGQLGRQRNQPTAHEADDFREQLDHLDAMHAR